MDRAFRVLLALTTTACAPAAWACSCLIYEPTRACEIRHSATTIFKGRVLDTNATVDGGFNTWALYRFRVDEIFKGLPAETKEVFIDPGSGTSCMTAFQLGQDYLVYTAKAITTSGDYFNRVRTTAQSPEMKVPAILPAWERATNSPVFWDMLCSPTRPIENEATDTDLAYLRSMSKTNAGDPPRLGTIFGTVAQNLDGLTTFKDAAPMKDVVVTLRPTSTSANAEPLTFSATSGPDGRADTRSNGNRYSKVHGLRHASPGRSPFRRMDVRRFGGTLLPQQVSQAVSSCPMELHLPRKWWSKQDGSRIPATRNSV
jgi:hypothetical protein